MDNVNWALVSPLIAVQLLIQIIALVDLYRREHVLGGRKLPWVLVVILFQIIGATVYLIIGRKEATSDDGN